MVLKHEWACFSQTFAEAPMRSLENIDFQHFFVFYRCSLFIPFKGLPFQEIVEYPPVKCGTEHASNGCGHVVWVDTYTPSKEQYQDHALGY